MKIDLATIQIIVSVIGATAVIVWRVAKAANDLKTLIQAVDRKVDIIEVKTVNVTEDHDKLVLVEASSIAMHKRLDEMKQQTAKRV